MTLEELGLNEKAKVLISFDQNDDTIGRVIVEHKDRYDIQTMENIFQAEITGGLRYSAESRADLPAVGDWVRLTIYDDNTAIITEVLPRFSSLNRKAVGKFGERQIIASNVDIALIMQAVGHDFNVNRLERYITICKSSSIQPVILLSKTDLISKEEIDLLTEKIKERIKSTPVYPLSNETHFGYDKLREIIQSGNTYCIIGSSGVGKSSLANNLLESKKLKINAISESTSKGKHTTSHRELMILPGGGVFIDTPGMRELGVAGDSEDIDQTFSQITELARYCKFNDCQHTEEPGCAVLEALELDKLDKSSYENYQKLKREQAHFSRTLAERRAKDKEQGKLYKRIQEEKRVRRGR